MKTLMRTAALLAAMVAVPSAPAQLIDPTTGVMVNVASDPADFSAVASGQPGNIGMEMAAQAAEQAAAQAQQAAANAQILSDEMDRSVAAAASAPANVNLFANTGGTGLPTHLKPPPAVPTTPSPTITPNSTRVAKGTRISLTDWDKAAIIVYTTDGTKPTLASPRYRKPIVLEKKTKLQALAFNPNKAPSAVMTRTFRVKRE